MVGECSRGEQELQKRGNGSANLVEGRRAQQRKIIPRAVICLLKTGCGVIYCMSVPVIYEGLGFGFVGAAAQDLNNSPT